MSSTPTVRADKSARQNRDNHSQRHRLHSRIVISFLLFGTIVSALFALSALLLQDYITDQLISRTLQDEIDQYVDQLYIDPNEVEPFYTRIDGYVTRPGQLDIVPNVFHDLPSGLHEVRDVNNNEFRAAIRKEPDFWVFLTYDVSANRSTTHLLIQAMIVSVLVFAGLSWLIGYWSAGRVMKPVRDLAIAVRGLSATHQHETLADQFADDEVGELALALDNYAIELHQRVARDNAFNADVSHELRTPLAVIIGATELLLKMPSMPEKAHERLLRIARAGRQSADITTALLHLARAERGVTLESNARDAAAVVADIVDLYQPLIGTRPLSIETDLQSPVNVIAPEAVIAVTVGNLLGNAIRYSTEGIIKVRVADGQIVIRDQGPGIEEADLPKIFDRHFRGQSTSGNKGAGLGLAIVKRLCELYGWQISFSNAKEGGLLATISFYAGEEGGVKH